MKSAVGFGDVLECDFNNLYTPIQVGQKTYEKPTALLMRRKSHYYHIELILIIKDFCFYLHLLADKYFKFRQ